MNWIKNNLYVIPFLLIALGITSAIICTAMAIKTTCEKTNPPLSNTISRNELAFRDGIGLDDWVMKINDYGIFFNREKYPLSTQDEFAAGVINILEHQYPVKFERR